MQASVSIVFNIAPAANPLVITPNTVTENLTVGVAADGTAVGTVSGGTPPYSGPTVDPASGPVPPGISFAMDGSGNITLVGTPTASGSSTTPVILDVTDASGAQAQLKAKLGK